MKPKLQIPYILLIPTVCYSSPCREGLPCVQHACCGRPALIYQAYHHGIFMSTAKQQSFPECCGVRPAGLQSAQLVGNLFLLLPANVSIIFCRHGLQERHHQTAAGQQGVRQTGRFLVSTYTARIFPPMTCKQSLGATKARCLSSILGCTWQCYIWLHSS